MTLVLAVMSGLAFRSEKVSIKSDIIILVDASDSNSASHSRMNVFIQDILSESGSDYNVGIITFANGNVYAAKLTNNTNKAYNDYTGENKKPDGSATNIAAALSYSKNQLNDPKDGRIILLSDGQETDGSTLVAAKSIASLGTRIDTVFFYPGSSGNETKISLVDVPDNISLNQSVEISVTVQSNYISNGILLLYDNDSLIGEKHISLTVGSYTHMFSHTFTTSKLHELRALLTSDTDTLPQNNEYYAFVNIAVTNKILIVDGTGSEAQKLSNLLDTDYNVDIVTLYNLPSTLSDLRVYDEVILLNVSGSELGRNNFDTMLSTYVRDYGGGLFTVGGDKAYNTSDMEGSLLESMLPVAISEQPPPKSVLVVLDRSSSMDKTIGSGSKSRMQIAKENLIDLLAFLNPKDYIGIVTFDNSVNQNLQLTPTTDKVAILRAINEIDVGYGTQYAPAIRSAGSMLSSAGTLLKHIIFITDGDAQDAEPSYYLDAVQQLGSSITLSVIGFGDDSALSHNETNLLQMAALGGGIYSYSATGNNISSLMLEHLIAVSGSTDHINNTPFMPIITSLASPVVYGIGTMPVLGGYYGGLSAKINATVVLTTGGNPVYAHWNYGLGKVGSFMSDLNGTWSDLYFNDPSGKRFIGNVVSTLFPLISAKSTDIKTEFLLDNYTTTLKITSLSNENDSINVTVTAPDGKTINGDVSRQSKSLFVAHITTSQKGIYTVEIVKKDRLGKKLSELTTYTSFSYSEEYTSFADESTTFAFMENIAKDGGGTVLYTATGMFSREAQTIVKTFDPTVLFLVLACILFLLDIVARKFKFKWPSEIIKDFKEKKAGIANTEPS